MRKQNSTSPNATQTPDTSTTSTAPSQLAARERENAVLDIWAKAAVSARTDKKSNTTAASTAKEQLSPEEHSARQQRYVLREMPTSLDTLTFSTVSRKVCQDIFLKAALMQGHDITYVPAWETYPFWIEEQVLKGSTSKTPLKLSVLRKRCRARHKQELEAQKQKYHQLGIFGDWDASQKTLESRQEARLIALISRLRDSDYLQDLPQLSPWCPKCSLAINEANLVPMQTHTVNSYVKFAFTMGLEEFGVNVFFALQMRHLWEIAGVVALGITEGTTYWLTEWQEEYLLFSEPQLEDFTKRLPKRQAKPKRVKEITAAELTPCSVGHPLFPSKDLKITLISDSIADAASEDDSMSALASGIMPLNPAHHQLSYEIARALGWNATPVFDEKGRFTEEVEQLCGLYVFDAEKFIVPQLERYGHLLKTEKDEGEEPHCPRCKELTVLRPCSKWVFSMSENSTTAQSLNSEEYWNNYGDTTHPSSLAVQKEVEAFGDLPVSAQRQWGMPLPILRCDQCDEPLTDKNTLNAIRSSIQRGFEFWFRLSVEELLPGDTRCLKCDSSDFRKEATLIDSHFANLLQIIDNSDFKKPLGGHTSVMFVPQTDTANSEWTKWLAEISVISAALSRSRPIKESQPFKQLKFNALPKIRGNLQFQDAFFNGYPADVVRLVSITPNGGTGQISHKKVQKLADDYLVGYQQLETLLERVSERLYLLLNTESGFEDATHAVYRDEEAIENVLGQTQVDTDIESMLVQYRSTHTLSRTDSLMIAVTSQLLQEVQQSYETGNYHEIWRMLTDFCDSDLRFYLHLMREETAGSDPLAKTTLLEITTAILQRLAPLTPFLAEHFYHLISAVDGTGDGSIFQKQWHDFSGIIRRDAEVPDSGTHDAKAEWETLKNASDTEI